MKPIFAAVLLAASAFAPAARATSVCDTLMAAMIRQAHAASHSVALVTQSGHQPETQETILVGGKMYFKHDGAWIAVPMPPRKLTDFYEQVRDGSKVTCVQGADTAVGGEAALVYTTHAIRANGDVIDTQTWLSKKTGLALKVSNHVKNAGGTTDIVATYDYRDIKAPELK